MKTQVKFRLSPEGRKAALLAGQCADAIQTVDVFAEAPEFAEVVNAGTIVGDDTVLLDTTKDWCSNNCKPAASAKLWNHVPTLRELLDDYVVCVATVAAINAAYASATHAATAAVLAERRTREASHAYGGGETHVPYTSLSPDWPLPSDQSVRESGEALQWREELEARNAEVAAAARAKHDALVADKDARAAAVAAETAQALAAQRASRNLRDGDDDFEVEDGALTQVPIYDSHKRSKNWLATIAVNPASPGGLDREFHAKAGGDSFYMLPSLAEGDAVEFGADYYSGSGRVTRDRWYGYVVRVEVQGGNGYVVLHKCATGKAACAAGAKHAAKTAAAVA